MSCIYTGGDHDSYFAVILKGRAAGSQNMDFYCGRPICREYENFNN